MGNYWFQLPDSRRHVPKPPTMSLGAGMSVIPSVRTSSFTVSPVLLWAGALALAVLATLGLARVIDHLRD